MYLRLYLSPCTLKHLRRRLYRYLLYLLGTIHTPRCTTLRSNPLLIRNPPLPIHRLLLQAQVPAGLLQIPLVHGRDRGGDARLRRERDGREDEALAEGGRVELRVRQERDPRVEGVAERVHDADDDGALLGVAAADLVRPAHAQGPVGDRRLLQEEGEPLQPRGDVPDREEQRGEAAEEGGDGHYGGAPAEGVRDDGEGHGEHELHGGGGGGDEVLLIG